VVLRKLAGLFARKEVEETFDLSEPGPLGCPQPVVVIGDIHGRIDLLERMLAQIGETLPEATPVFVGDYVDRGEESAAVLARLMETSGKGAVCLMGNHEEMLLNYLDDPEGRGGTWLRNGGLQTLASFGVGGVSANTRGLELARARDELVVRMGEEMIGWLRERPLWWRSGSVGVVHAGADPTQPIEAQERRNLLWGHKDFRRKARSDGLWIVHGHTIVADAGIEGGRISVDTGAYATGLLSGVVLGAGEVRFMTA
jgi:serine/threonine protein phosphatase 1